MTLVHKVKSTVAQVAAIIMCTWLSACNHLFYYPDEMVRVTPERLKISYDDHYVETKDHQRLHLWHMKSKAHKPYATVLHFHGNAENMTTHVLFVAWLTNLGFDVVTFDYRGYGSSTGFPEREGLVEDGRSILKWTRDHARTQDLFIIGQSLGGAVVLPALAETQVPGVKAIVLDSTFASYRKMAQYFLDGLWLTWPLQWPLSFLVTDNYSPVDSIAQVPGPKLFMHSPGDPVVPFKAGMALYEQTPQPKEFWPVPWSGHTAALMVEDDQIRRRLVAYLCQHLSKPDPNCH